MTSFNKRLLQLLDAGSNLTVNQRERFLRPLRQIDVACQNNETDTQSIDVIKAATRVMAHQMLEAMCFHLENALSRCQNENQRMLLTALVAQAALNSHSIKFREANKQLPSINYPTMKTWIVEINPTTTGEKQSDFLISQKDRQEVEIQVFITNEYFSNKKSASHDIYVSEAQLRENPFACANEIFCWFG